MNKFSIAVLAFAITARCGSLCAATTQPADLPNSDLKAGQTIPELSGTDQFGKPQDFDSLKGPNGLVLLFFRSADW
jgi:hypothetical protein